MPEDTAAPVEDTQATPEVDAPEPGNASESPEDSPAVDWESADNPFKGRYDNLRSDYDRKNQRLSQFETFIGHLQDPETQAEALRALGLELEDTEPDDDTDLDDPDERYEKRFSQLEQYIQQEADQKAQAEVAELERQFFDEEFAKLEKEHGKLSDEERKAIEAISFSILDDEELPDVEQAYKTLNGIVDTRQERYLESKKADRVEIGQAGKEKVNLADDDARVNLLANMVEANSQEE